MNRQEIADRLRALRRSLEAPFAKAQTAGDQAEMDRLMATAGEIDDRKPLDDFMVDARAAFRAERLTTFDEDLKQLFMQMCAAPAPWPFQVPWPAPASLPLE